jgi:hypothetical protein
MYRENVDGIVMLSLSANVLTTTRVMPPNGTRISVVPSPG